MQLQDLLGSCPSTNLINESKVSSVSPRCFLALQITSLTALIIVLCLTSSKQNIRHSCMPTAFISEFPHPLLFGLNKVCLWRARGDVFSLH